MSDRDAITIRPAAGRDAEFILGLVPRFVEFPLPGGRRADELASRFGRDLERALESGAAIFVAEDSAGGAVGFIHLHRVVDLTGHERAHVGDLAVAAAAQGRGAGGALMEFAESWAAAEGLGTIGLTAIVTNERALAFYASRGYSADTVTLVKHTVMSGST